MTITRRRLLAGIGGGAALLTGGWISALRSPAPGATTSPTRAAPETTVRSAKGGVDTTTTPTTTTTTARPRVVEVICRDAWGAAEPTGDFTRHTIDRLTLHHTAVRLESNVDAPAQARAHQAFHQDSGFVDLAYHFMVDLEGNVLEGRPVAYAGETFTEYDPTGHLLVCCEGDYDRQAPTDSQLVAVANVFAWGCLTFAVAASTLGGHRDYASSSCPGDYLYGTVADGSLRAAIEAAIADGVERHDLCGPAAEAKVDAIATGA